MRLIYILFSSFLVFLAIISYYQFKRGNIGVSSFVILSLSFCSLAVLSLFPGITDTVANLVGMNVRVNFIILILMIVTASFIFIQIKAHSLIRRELNQIIQQTAITHLYSSSQSEGGRKREKKNNTLVKIAAFNEEKNLGDVLQSMLDSVDVLIIDDGSTDRTREVAAKHGAIIARHVKNMGQGMADVTGFQVAFDLGYKYIVEMDGDGQHNPAEIPLFISELEEHPDLDIVVGSRVLGSQNADADFLRVRFLPLYTRMINWASGYSLTDGLCGFKAYRTDSLIKCENIFRDLLETEYIAAELYMRFGKAGLRVAEIPVHVSGRTTGKSYKGTFRYGFAVAWIILRTFFGLK